MRAYSESQPISVKSPHSRSYTNHSHSTSSATSLPHALSSIVHPIANPLHYITPHQSPHRLFPTILYYPIIHPHHPSRTPSLWHGARLSYWVGIVLASHRPKEPALISPHPPSPLIHRLHHLTASFSFGDGSTSHRDELYAATLSAFKHGVREPHKIRIQLTHRLRCTRIRASEITLGSL
jgi:hypothetical protein